MTDLEKKVNFEYTKKEDSYRYMLLDRMRTDCNYFLGNGNGNEKVLWAGNIKDHMAVMKELWDSFDSDKKPECLSLEELSKYENQMTVLKEVRDKLNDLQISNFEYDGEGYLHFTIEADNHLLDGLYRIHDRENGESLKLVSVDYGYQHPVISEKWSYIENTISEYAKIHYADLVNTTQEESQRQHGVSEPEEPNSVAVNDEQELNLQHVNPMRRRGR